MDYSDSEKNRPDAELEARSPQAHSARNAAPRFLIDGYNLLFQSNLVGKGRGAKWLRRARNQLYKLLRARLQPTELAATQIVFDASQATAPKLDASELIPEGAPMKVTFASQYSEADELLEEIIQHHPHPKTLLVVSSDHRVQKRGKAKRTQVMDSEDFLDWLDHRRPPVEPAATEDSTLEQESPLDAEEVDYWLREFDRGKE